MPIRLICFVSIVFISLSGLSGTRFAQAEDLKATIIGYGEIEGRQQDTAINSKNSHNGSLFVMDKNVVPAFKSDINKIAIKQNSQFGIEVQLDGGLDGAVIPVKTRWTHPKFSDGATVEEWDSPMNIGYGRYAGWVVENESELVEGDWTIEILYKGKVLAAKTFEIIVSDNP